MPKKPREVIYDLAVQICHDSKGGALTSVGAKKLLGWTETRKGAELFKDLYKTPIVCSNNDFQRPYYKAVARDLMHDILAGNWQFNLETVIVGETGLVLDGKHRLIALVLACQEYELREELYPFWADQSPEIEILIAFGAKESKEIVNTIGTGKTRSLADSFYASGVLGEGKNLRQLTKMAEFAVRMLWQRTGAKDDAFHSRLSHAEALDFLDRHSAVLQCVRIIFDLEKGPKKRISRLISCGYASALLYLMSVSASDKKYHLDGYPSEDLLDFYTDEKAENYWALLASKDKLIKPVYAAIAKLAEEGNSNPNERVAILIKGWNSFSETGKVMASQLKLKTVADQYGERQLVEDPLIKGIDVGFTGGDNDV